MRDLGVGEDENVCRFRRMRTRVGEGVERGRRWDVQAGIWESAIRDRVEELDETTFKTR